MKSTVVVKHCFPMVPSVGRRPCQPQRSHGSVIGEVWLQVFLTVGIQLCENNEKQQYVMVSGIDQRRNNLVLPRGKAQRGMVQCSPTGIILSMFAGSVSKCLSLQLLFQWKKVVHYI